MEVCSRRKRESLTRTASGGSPWSPQRTRQPYRRGSGRAQPSKRERLLTPSCAGPAPLQQEAVSKVAAPKLASPAQPGRESSSLTRRQWQVLLAVASAYGASIVCYRPMISAALPDMLSDLGVSRQEGGQVLSIGALCYMFAKPALLALSDRLPPTALLMASMVFSGVSFVLLGMAPDLLSMKVAIVLLHLFQAGSWPGVAGTMIAWFPPEMRGVPWSITASQQNFVAALVPALLIAAIQHLGSWRSAFVAFGVFYSAAAVVPALAVPAKCKHDGSDVPPPKAQPGQRTDDGGSARCSAEQSATQLVPRCTRWGTLADPRVASCLLMAFSNTFLYMVRYGAEFWIGSFFTDLVGDERASRYNVLFHLWMQVGGGIGALAAGPATDKLCRGRRLPSVVLGGTAMAASLVLLPEPSAAVASAVGFVVGCACFANRVLLLLAVRQAVPTCWGGRAEAFGSLFAELGSICAGWPLIALAEAAGGRASLGHLLVASAVAHSVFAAAALAFTDTSRQKVA